MKILALEEELDNARTIDFRKEKNLAVLILEATSKEKAKMELSKLPYVSKKLIEFELIPLKPYSGFQRLFR